MTLTTLVIGVAIAAAIMTWVMLTTKQYMPNSVLSYFQNFCGALFIFSGAVKVIDPLGTAYKMEQYFAQFESTFSETWLSFISPIFPALNDVSVAFSVIVIVFEIVLGIMLILGDRHKFTARAFFALVLFFTFLTGFTYLTGYVPQSENFFDFAAWGAFTESNMRVTDCGCFGDFLKLKPKVSFIKDIVLLIPATWFLLKSNEMHDIATEKVRNIAVVASTAAFTLFGLYNFVYDLPIADFRPFKNGTDVRGEKQRQAELVANAPIYFIYRNPNDTTETKQFSDTELGDIPEGWEYLDRIQEEVEGTNKISDFVGIMGKTVSSTTYLMYDTGEGEPYLELSPEDTADGGVEEGWTFVKEEVSEQVIEGEVTDAILSNPNPSFMIVCHDLHKTNKEAFVTKVANLAKEANAKGIEIYAVVAKATEAEVEEFRAATGVSFEFYTADDVLLKTIVRSNPGIVLWKDGVLVQKWHHRHLPSLENIEANFLK